MVPRSSLQHGPPCGGRCCAHRTQACAQCMVHSPPHPSAAACTCTQTQRKPTFAVCTCTQTRRKALSRRMYLHASMRGDSSHLPTARARFIPRQPHETNWPLSAYVPARPMSSSWATCPGPHAPTDACVWPTCLAHRSGHMPRALCPGVASCVSYSTVGPYAQGRMPKSRLMRLLLDCRAICPGPYAREGP